MSLLRNMSHLRISPQNPATSRAFVPTGPKRKGTSEKRGRAGKRQKTRAADADDDRSISWIRQHLYDPDERDWFHANGYIWSGNREMWWHPDPDVREQYEDSDDDDAAAAGESKSNYSNDYPDVVYVMIGTKHTNDGHVDKVAPPDLMRFQGTVVDSNSVTTRTLYKSSKPMDVYRSISHRDHQSFAHNKDKQHTSGHQINFLRRFYEASHYLPFSKDWKFRLYAKITDPDAYYKETDLYYDFDPVIQAVHSKLHPPFHKKMKKERDVVLNLLKQNGIGDVPPSNEPAIDGEALPVHMYYVQEEDTIYVIESHAYRRGAQAVYQEFVKEAIDNPDYFDDDDDDDLNF